MLQFLAKLRSSKFPRSLIIVYPNQHLTHDLLIRHNAAEQKKSEQTVCDCMQFY